MNREHQVELVRQVQQYFRDEFDLELGDLRAGFVVEFFSKLIGPVHYNQAVEDARAVVIARAQTMDEEIFGLTRPVPGRDATHRARTGPTDGPGGPGGK